MTCNVNVIVSPLITKAPAFLIQDIHLYKQNISLKSASLMLLKKRLIVY